MRERLEIEDFLPHVGTSFQVQAFLNGESASINLKLVSAEAQQLHPKDGRLTLSDSSIRKVPFSLLFSSDLNQQLEQGTYRVLNSGLGDGWEMFICCIGPNAEKTALIYQVIYG